MADPGLEITQIGQHFVIQTTPTHYLTKPVIFAKYATRYHAERALPNYVDECAQLHRILRQTDEAVRATADQLRKGC